MKAWHWPAVLVAWALLIAAALALTRVGFLGFGLFVALPFLMGALAGWSRPAETTGGALAQGALTATIGCFFFVLMGIEGLICTAMALPLAVPLGMLGGWFSFKLHTTRSGARSAALILLPFGLGSAAYDVAVVPAVYEVTTSVEIAASPETVWRHVITYSEMPAPTEWLFRAGIAYPRRVRLAGTGVGATRFCDFSTGSFVEPITVWEPARRLEFDVVASAAPMQEWSPYGAIQPAHLHGYFKSRKGRFVLQTLANGHTLLSGTSWYEHGLEPAPYWRWWSDAIIHQIHQRVLGHIKHLSEAPGRAS